MFCPRVILSDHVVKNIWKTRQQLGLHGESKIFRFLGFLCGFLTKNVKIVNVHWKNVHQALLLLQYQRSLVRNVHFKTNKAQRLSNTHCSHLQAQNCVFQFLALSHKVSGRTMIKEIAATLAWFSAVNLS
jgi:hypothetical protein